MMKEYSKQKVDEIGAIQFDEKFLPKLYIPTLENLQELHPFEFLEFVTSIPRKVVV